MRQEEIFNHFEDKMTDALLPKHVEYYEYAEAIELFHTRFRDFEGSYNLSKHKELFYIPLVYKVDRGVHSYAHFQLNRLAISQTGLELIFEFYDPKNVIAPFSIVLSFTLEDEEATLFYMKINEQYNSKKELYVSTNDLREFGKKASDLWVNYFISIYYTKRKPKFYLEPKMLAKLFIILTNELTK